MIFIAVSLRKNDEAPLALHKESAPRVLDTARFHLDLFTHSQRLTRAAREGIFSPRLGSGGDVPIRRPLSAAAALSVRMLLNGVFSVNAFD